MTEVQPGYEIGPLLRRAHHKAAGVLGAALAPLDLQVRHFGVLLMLHQKEPLSQRELIDRLGSDKTSMVRIIDELEGRGLCVRQPSAADRRANAIHLTDAGRHLYGKAERAAKDTGAVLLAGLSAPDQELLCDLLRRFVDTMPAA